jgi:hypothetical protein
MEGARRGHTHLHLLLQRVDLDGGCSDSRNTDGSGACPGIHGFGTLPYLVGRARQYDSLGKDLQWHLLGPAGSATRSAQHKHAAFERAIPGMESRAYQKQTPRQETKKCDGLARLYQALSRSAGDVIFSFSLLSSGMLRNALYFLHWEGTGRATPYPFSLLQ